MYGSYNNDKPLSAGWLDGRAWLCRHKDVPPEEERGVFRWQREFSGKRLQKTIVQSVNITFMCKSTISTLVIKHGWLENPRTEWRFEYENY